MAVTVAQIRAGKAQLLDRLWLRYPAARRPLLRLLMQFSRQGDATDREVAQAIMAQIAQASEGALDHRARHLLAEALSDSDDGITSIDDTDISTLLPGVP